MSIPIKTKNLRVLMIQALKQIINDPAVKVSTKFESDKGGSQVRVSYMGSDRVSTMFLSADYSIDVLCQTFDEAERLSYLICDEIQEYKRNNIVDAEVQQFPIDFIEEGITGELRSISLEVLVRPDNR